MTRAFPGSLVVKRVGDPNQPLHNALNENNIVLEVRPSDDFLQLMETLNFTRRGKTSWSTPNLVEGAPSGVARRFAQEYEKKFATNTVFLNERGDVGHWKGYTDMPPEIAFRMDYPLITFSDRFFYGAGLETQGSPVWYAQNSATSLLSRRIGINRPNAFQGNAQFAREWKAMSKHISYGTVMTKEFPSDFSSLVFVMVSLERDQFWIRLRASEDIINDSRFSLTKMLGMRVARDSIIKPAEAVIALRSLETRYGNLNIDQEASADALAFISQADDYVLVGSVKNEPANANIWKGKEVTLDQKKRRSFLKKNQGIVLSKEAIWEEPVNMPMSEILALKEGSNVADKFLIHDSLLDIVNMSEAQPFEGEPRLREFQKEAVGLHLATSIGYLQSCSPGLGKGHPLTTNVLTPSGWRQVGDLEKGDAIFGSDGKPTTITGIFPRGELDVFRVSFNDGSSVLVDGDHLWAVQTKSGLKKKVVSDDTSAQAIQLSFDQRKQMVDLIQGGQTRHATAIQFGVSPTVTSYWWKRFEEQGYEGLRNIGSEPYKVKSTSELAEILTDKAGVHQWRIPMTQPIEYTPTEALTVPAYTMGLILGDGSIANGSIQITSADEDIESLLREDVPAGIVVTKLLSKDRTPAYSLTLRPKAQRNPMVTALRGYGLMGTRSHTKFIPEAYLRASIADRIALLQGMLDSDGYYNKKDRYLQWGSVSKQMADDMAELIESFGGSVRRSELTKSYKTATGEKKIGKLYYSLSIALPNGITPFRMKRKLNGYVPRQYRPVRIMTSIVPVGREEVRCISVAAENRLYITEHHIVTHNTVCQLAAMRERAKRYDNYRGLVIVESNLPHQWKEEQEVWFPEAHTVLIASAIKDKDALQSLSDALAMEGPVLIIMTGHNLLGVLKEHEKRVDDLERHSAMTLEELAGIFAQQKVGKPSVAKMILDTRWNDLCSDESTVIRTGNSKQNDAMWILRQNADLATSLTGTPINTSIDDIARLLSWVRNDRNLFSNKLSTLYDPTDPDSAAAMFNSLGPIIFRRDTSVEESMPTVAEPIVFSITPKPAERALVVAAERELRRCYMELLTALENLEGNTGVDADELAAAKAALTEARGAWLGGTTLARMASSDAATLLDSSSVGAALLASQGLVENAVNAGSSKQERLIEDLLPRIQRGQQALVFTEFSSVATRLVEALEANGIRAKGFTGRNPKTRDAARVAFQNGEVDVLVLTSAGTRGLTLHKASVLYHYDLPWTPERIIQRTGRLVRIGSENEMVETIFLIMEGAIEQRMAEHLVGLSMVSTLVLDHSRGADMNNNNSVGAMKGLISNVVRTTEKSSFKLFGEMLGIEQIAA